jgi:hypothetical protein
MAQAHKTAEPAAVKPASDPLGASAILLEIAKKLSSQALLFGLAVIVVIVGAWYLFGSQALLAIGAIVVVFLISLLAYLFVEQKRKTETDALAWLGRSDSEAPTTGGAPDGAFAIDLWVQPKQAEMAASRDVAVVDKAGRRFRVGDSISVMFRSTRDCYLILLNLGTSGALTILFPNAHCPDNFVRAHEIHCIPEVESGFEFRLQGPVGLERLKAVGTSFKMPLLEGGIRSDGSLFDSRPPSAAARDIAIVQRAVGTLRPEDRAEATVQFEVTSA